MKFFFPTRKDARSFTKTSNRNLKVGDARKDDGTVADNKRWFVSVK